MANKLILNVNGRRVETEAVPQSPLLHALRNDAHVTGPQFGCGLGQCGSCTVLLSGKPVKACAVTVATAAGAPVVTLEGLARGGRGTPALHPVQRAFVEEQATQCGYCISGWVMAGVALLAEQPQPTDADIRKACAGLKCRCGAHMSMLRAIRRAAGIEG